MPGEVLVDTNVIIAVFKSQPAILDRLKSAAEIYLSSVTVGELIFGALKSTNQASNLKRIDELIENAVVLACDTETARCYAGIKHELKQRGNRFRTMTCGLPHWRFNTIWCFSRSTNTLAKSASFRSNRAVDG
jgi:predicted nucleic acid-binding protein